MGGEIVAVDGSGVSVPGELIVPGAAQEEMIAAANKMMVMLIGFMGLVAGKTGFRNCQSLFGLRKKPSLQFVTLWKPSFFFSEIVLRWVSASR